MHLRVPNSDTVLFLSPSLVIPRRTSNSRLELDLFRIAIWLHKYVGRLYPNYHTAYVMGSGTREPENRYQNSLSGSDMWVASILKLFRLGASDQFRRLPLSPHGRRSPAKDRHSDHFTVLVV